MQILIIKINEKTTKRYFFNKKYPGTNNFDTGNHELHYLYFLGN